ncbi:MAG: hypothetical protein ACI35W_07955 [Anaeroplasmataceae bacterium]
MIFHIKTLILNLYAYCGNNPVNMVDPSGHLSKWAAWLISGALIVGGIVLSVATAGVATHGVVGVLATIGSIFWGQQLVQVQVP